MLRKKMISDTLALRMTCENTCLVIHTEYVHVPIVFSGNDKQNNVAIDVNLVW